MIKDIAYKYTNTGVYPIRYIARRNYNNKSAENLNRGFRTLGVSAATMNKIKTACRVLSYASELRKVRNSQGNYVNHLCMFITLTLPYEQTHEDKEITKYILGDFMDRCRKSNMFQNYVWRAEKQKNGNIHYHIITDSFCSYSMIYRLWKLSLDKLDYVKKYSEKFINMSYTAYRRLPHNKSLSEQKVSEKFAKGVRENWKNPPCVKVDYTNDVSQVSAYIAKYTAKNEDLPNIVTGRVWSCSQSVSDSVKVFKKDEQFNKFWYQVGSEMMNRKVIDSDFFSICEFRFTSLIAWFTDVKDYIFSKLREVFQPCNFYRRCLGYAT